MSESSRNISFFIVILASFLRKFNAMRVCADLELHEEVSEVCLEELHIFLRGE